MSLFFLTTVVLSPTVRDASLNGGVGFGAGATGGAGGDTVVVTSLADSGPGSLRAALVNGKRTITFAVGGAIALQSPLSVPSDVTIDGESAPGEGITIGGEEVSFSNSHNVVVRWVRIRQGLTGGQRKSAVAIHAGSDMLFDHCSIEWGRWDCIDANDSHDLTFQNCIIGQGVNPQRFGCLCGSDNVTFFQNLFIDNQSRNPKAKGHVQYVNNVVYNWGVTGFVGGHSAAVHYADLIDNYFIKGPSSSSHFVGEFTATDQIYQSGNYVDMNGDGTLNGRAVVASDFTGATVVAAPFAAPLAPMETAQSAFETVVAHAGDSVHRDAVDTRLIEEAQSLGTRGRIVEDPADAAKSLAKSPAKMQEKTP